LIGSAAAPTYFALAGAMFFVGAASGAFQTLNGALVSTIASREYLGRVLSLTFMAFALSNVLSFPFGALADVVGERAMLAASGVAVTVTAVGFGMLERGSAAFTGRER
jgi:predicted MFS family arabinose efflux permease